MQINKALAIGQRQRHLLRQLLMKALIKDVAEQKRILTNRHRNVSNSAAVREKQMKHGMTFSIVGDSLKQSKYLAQFENISAAMKIYEKLKN